MASRDARRTPPSSATTPGTTRRAVTASATSRPGRAGAFPRANCSTRSRPEPWLDALDYLAGPAAEARWRGFAEEALLPALPRLGDGKEALDDLRRLGREGELPAAWREAWALVGDVWPAVEAVAGALREREELAGEEVGRIAATAMPGRFPLVEAGLGTL